MLRMLLLVVLASTLLFEGTRHLGWLPEYPFPLLGPAALVNLIGAAVFGFGMVLAGGCVVGTLYKLGAGSMLSLTAFAGLIAGSALYAEIHPWWREVSEATRLGEGHVSLFEVLGLPAFPVVAAFAVLLALLLYGISRSQPWQRTSLAEGYLQPWKAALILSGIGLLSYLLVGMPLGITTSYAKIGAYAETLFAPDHVAELTYFQARPLSYVPPLTNTRVTGGAGPKLDAIASIQFPLILGVIGGGFLSAVLVREFQVRFRLPARQYGLALAGGLIMGLGARMTPACNIWHLLGGLPILAVQSLLFLVGLLPGAWLGSLLLRRLVMR
jgi:uncharacterized membrane protein YedE/YeeE